MGPNVRQGAHHGAHQSMIRIPGFSTCSWKFSPVSATVAIHILRARSMGHATAAVERGSPGLKAARRRLIPQLALAAPVAIEQLSARLTTAEAVNCWRSG